MKCSDSTKGDFGCTSSQVTFYGQADSPGDGDALAQELAHLVATVHEGGGEGGLGYGERNNRSRWHAAPGGGTTLGSSDTGSRVLVRAPRASAACARLAARSHRR